MKQIGYYVNKSYDQLLFGYIDCDGRLNAKVLFDKYGCFYSGYKYPSWARSDYIYLGRPKIYNSLESFLEFISGADYDQLRAYLKCKNILVNGAKIKEEQIKLELSILRACDKLDI
jgi:hypothetical protein